MSIHEFVAWSVDFEGSISLKRSYDRRFNRFYYSSWVDLSNTSLTLLQRFQGRAGIGRVNPNAAKFRDGNRRDIFYWRLSAFEIREHLPSIQSFLTLKKRQAEIVLEAESLKPSLPLSIEDRRIHYSSSLYEQLEKLYLECRELNNPTKTARSEQEEFYRILRER